MIRVFYNDKNICECCDNDSEIFLDFTEDSMKYKNLGTTLYLCNVCKSRLIELLYIYKQGDNV